MKSIRYQRRAEVLLLTGVSNSTLHNRINNGLFVPPVSLGARSVGWLEHEVTEVLAARAKGLNDNGIRTLVKGLIESRSQLASAGGA